ncbi:MAG: DMT family transporter [Nanoarchaeota archaeon]
MNKIYLIFLTAIISGFSIFINKFGVEFNNPYVFTFIKNSVVFIFLFGLILLLKEHNNFKLLKRNDWYKLIIIGFIGGSIPFLLFFKGLQITSSANASFIHKTMFLYVAVLAYIFLKERFSWKVFAASGALILGNFLLLKLTWQPFNIGDAMILVATLFWAVENTLSKHILQNVPSKITAFSRMFFGSIFILIFLVASGNINEMFVLTQNQLLWAIVPSVFLVLYLLTWYEGLKYIPATLATAILLLGSPITTLLNIIQAGASITLQQSFGIALLVSGITMFLYSVEEIKLPSPTKFVT